MVLFIIIFILYFGWLGERLFRGTVEGVEYFSDFPTSCWSLLVLLTTANFPDVMLPAYQENRFYAFFFVTYLVLGLYLFMNLLLAIFYSNYKTRYDQQLNKFVHQRTNYLNCKFEQMDKD